MSPPASAAAGQNLGPVPVELPALVLEGEVLVRVGKRTLPPPAKTSAKVPEPQLEAVNDELHNLLLGRIDGNFPKPLPTGLHSVP